MQMFYSFWGFEVQDLGLLGKESFAVLELCLCVYGMDECASAMAKRRCISSWQRQLHNSYQLCVLSPLSGDDPTREGPAGGRWSVHQGGCLQGDRPHDVAAPPKHHSHER